MIKDWQCWLDPWLTGSLAWQIHPSRQEPGRALAVLGFKEVIVNGAKPILRYLIWAGVILLQLVLTQVVTLIFSFFIPNADTFPDTQPLVFAVLMMFTFTAGVYLGGWLALRWRWLPFLPRYASRLAGTLVGVSVPLLLAILFGSLGAGSPLFFFSIVGGIVGFYLPGWRMEQAMT